MTSANMSNTLVASYPEVNPFETDPPVFNLTPFTAEYDRSRDTPEFLAAALVVTEKSGFNPLRWQYCSNPFVIIDDRVRIAKLPFKAYKAPPPLREAVLPEDTVFTGQISKHSNTVLLTIRARDETMLLKLFPDRERIEVINNPNFLDKSTPHMLSVDPFDTECEAYAHLLHYGVCAAGAVPKCHGWLELGAQHLRQIGSLPDLSDRARAMLRSGEPPRGILLEYFADAVQLNVSNVTETLADNALRGLYKIHASYVLHCDVHPRNILVLPGDRVVWVDFNFSRNASGDWYLPRQRLFYEFGRAWALFYQQLLPDQRIGYFPPDYDQF